MAGGGPAEGSPKLSSWWHANSSGLKTRRADHSQMGDMLWQRNGETTKPIECQPQTRLQEGLVFLNLVANGQSGSQWGAKF